MKVSAVATAFLSLIPLLTGLGGVADGGNVDFYRCPLSIGWFLLTAYSVCSQNYSSLIAFIRRAWWLQLVMPLVLFALSLGLTDFYMPHPWPKDVPPAQAAPASSTSPAKRP
jgi:hypothetical protein